MEGLAIFAEVLSTAHEFSHLIEHGICPSRHLVPSAFEAVYRCCTKRGYDGCECGVVVELSAFLHVSVMLSVRPLL